MTLVKRAADQHAIDAQRRQLRRDVHIDHHAAGKPQSIRLDHLVDQLGQRRLDRPRLRHRRKARELRRDLAQQPHLAEDVRHALVDHATERPALVDVHAAQVLGIQLDRRQRILDVVRHLARHVGPRGETVGALELAALALQVVGHLVEGIDQPPQFVGRGGEHARVEIATGDPAGGTHQSIHRIGNALGHVIANRRAHHHEQHRRQQHPAIELVDLGFGFLLTRRERDGEHGFAALEPHRRGGNQVFEIAGPFAADE